MHLAYHFEAFTELMASGRTEQQAAGRFGVSVLTGLATRDAGKPQVVFNTMRGAFAIFVASFGRHWSGRKMHPRKWLIPSKCSRQVKNQNCPLFH